MKLVALLCLVNPNSFALIDSEICIFIHVTLLEFFHCLANSSFTCGSSFTIKMMYGLINMHISESIRAKEFGFTRHSRATNFI